MDITNISAALSSAKWMEVDKPLTDSHPSLFKGIRKQVLLYDAVGFLLYGVVVCGVCVCVLFFYISSAFDICWAISLVRWLPGSPPSVKIHQPASPPELFLFLFFALVVLNKCMKFISG